jgi:hypothetical protein
LGTPFPGPFRAHSMLPSLALACQGLWAGGGCEERFPPCP